MTRALPLAALLCTTALTAAAQEAADAVEPEAATEAPAAFAGLGQPAQDALAAKAAGEAVTAQTYMVAAANPLAVEAGVRVLSQHASETSSRREGIGAESLDALGSLPELRRAGVASVA